MSDGKKTDGQWRIEARAFPVPYTPFTHNFWVLAAPSGEVKDQLHGLAIDPRTGAAKAVGCSRHLLQVVQDASIGWALRPGQPSAVCAAGGEQSVRERWQAAVAAIPAINALGLRYPNLWQHGRRANSNSVFGMLGRIMGFGVPERLLPTLAPGIRAAISPAIVDRYRYKGPDA